jgi:hypothetical protein
MEAIEVGRWLRSILSKDVMWEVAPESMTQEEVPWTDICWRAAMNPT